MFIMIINCRIKVSVTVYDYWAEHQPQLVIKL